jgi:hypothetical protein
MNLEELVLEAIDESLSSMGQNCKKSIYFHLENDYNLNKLEIPFRIKDFSEAIEKIFGVGAKILEIQILRILFKKMGYINPQFYNHESLELTTYIEAARANRNFLLRTQTHLTTTNPKRALLKRAI